MPYNAKIKNDHVIVKPLIDFLHRLRRAEEKEHLLSSKRSESSLLLANITNSLSQMSLTVAENQLQISGLSEVNGS